MFYLFVSVYIDVYFVFDCDKLLSFSCPVLAIIEAELDQVVVPAMTNSAAVNANRAGAPDLRYILSSQLSVSGCVARISRSPVRLSLVLDPLLSASTRSEKKARCPGLRESLKNAPDPVLS